MIDFNQSKMETTKSKSILFMLHLPPPVHGSSMVGQMIHDSLLINSEFQCNYIDLLASHNVAETGSVSFKKLLEFVFLWFKTLFSVVFNRPNLVYFALTTTGYALLRDVLLVALLKLFHLKRIYHLHNKGISNYQNRPFFRLLYNFVFKDTEVILLSNLLYDDVKEFVPKSKVHICPNGISDLFENVRLNNLKNYDDNLHQTPELLFLSNLIESKGVYDLLEACAILKRNDVNFHCTFIGGEGDITMAEFDEKVKHLYLSDKVDYVGKKFGNDKVKALSNADIFVFPTYYPKECFPLVILEAMSAGLPVISTFEGGIPDIIDDGVNGYLVEQRNVQMLANQLEKLLTDPNFCKEMGKAGRDKFEKKFDIEIFEHKLTKILRR
jgi:glycosyltransferase involved in cell wall biosynthesis